MLTYVHPEAVKRFMEANHLQWERPSVALLERLGAAFQKMPYENMTKIIMAGRETDVRLRLRLPEILYEEHLRYGTGGTCFSMTYFMQTILRALSFETYPVMADRPLAPNTHCASVIILNQKKFLLDPGFMIDRPILLTEIPARHSLRHNDLIIGAKGTIPIQPRQMKYFREFYEKRGPVILPLCKGELEGVEKIYTIATSIGGKSVIRYFLKNTPVTPEAFLDFWLDSFNWPTLRNISITTVTENGYIYARNNFLRTTTRDGKRQTRVKELELTFSRVFNIDQRIIRDAFEVLKHGKC